MIRNKRTIGLHLLSPPFIAREESEGPFPVHWRHAVPIKARKIESLSTGAHLD